MNSLKFLIIFVLVFGQLVFINAISNPFDMDNLRYSNGRTFDGNSKLAKLVKTNADAYWNKVGGKVRRFIESKSDQMISQWNQTVANNVKVKNQVSNECLQVIEYMLRNPIKEEWTAKSNFFKPIV